MSSPIELSKPEVEEHDSSANAVSSKTIEDKRDNSANVSSKPTQDKHNNSDIDISSTLTFTLGKSSGHDTKMFVASCDKVTRQNACLFCGKKFTQISKHLQRLHRNEDRVKNLLKVKSPKSKKKLLCDLRKEGNAAFNKNPTLNNGELIVTRRPKEKLKRIARDYLPCVICKATFSKRSLRKHFKKCSKKTNNNQRIIMALGRLEADRIEPNASIRTRRELCFLREDEIGQTVRQDGLIIEWANFLFSKYRQNQEQSMVRNRLRLVARLLIAVKEIDPRVNEMMDIYNVLLYDSVIDAVNTVAKYNPETDMYDAPANGSQLGNFINEVGKRLLSVCIRRGLEDKQKEVDKFLKYHSNEFSVKVNRTVAESQVINKLEKRIELPTDEDIKTFYEYLEAQRASAYNKLKDKFNVKEWQKLSEMTLLLLLVFNRRRPGELERIKITDFENRRTMQSDATKLVYKSLTKSGKEAIDKYERVEIRGKKMRIVPVLFSEVMVNSVKLILEMRQNAKVNSKNPYVFGIYSFHSGRNNFIRACAVMRVASQASGAINPHLLRATGLRKHIATKCFALQIKQTQVDDLANFLGHEKEIHKKVYRQPIPELEIAKVAGLLENALGETDGEDSEEEEEADTEAFQKEKQNIFREFIISLITSLLLIQLVLLKNLMVICKKYSICS